MLVIVIINYINIKLVNTSQRKYACFRFGYKGRILKNVLTNIVKYVKPISHRNLPNYVPL